MTALLELPRCIVHDRLQNAQEQLSDGMRKLVCRAAPDLAERLDFEDDSTFLEPLLFAYFSQPRSPVTLDQILFGYMPRSSRPPEIHVYSDRHGIVTLPGIGNLHTPVVNGELRLQPQSDGGVELARDGFRVDFAFAPPFVFRRRHIELYRPHHPMLEMLFVDNAGKRITPTVSGEKAQHAGQIDRALDAIERCAPEYYAQMLAVTRGICLYAGAQPFSFAAMAAHGIAFLNTPEDADEVYFVEDLIHQCGHIILSALTLDRQALLTVTPEHPLRDITGHAQETRSVYEALHGLFTEAWMNRCFDACCEDPCWSPTQRHELLGRFALILTRFGADLQNLANEGLFTPSGRELWTWCAALYRAIVSQRHDLLSSLDVSSQPYAFHYASFLERNPLSD